MAQPSWSFFFLWRGKLSADTRRYLFSLAGPAGVWFFATRVLRAGCYDGGRGPFQGSSCEHVRGCRHELQTVVLLMHRRTWAVTSSNKTQETIFIDSTKESVCFPACFSARNLWALLGNRTPCQSVKKQCIRISLFSFQVEQTIVQSTCQKELYQR